MRTQMPEECECIGVFEVTEFCSAALVRGVHRNCSAWRPACCLHWKQRISNK